MQVTLFYNLSLSLPPIMPSSGTMITTPKCDRRKRRKRHRRSRTVAKLQFFLIHLSPVLNLIFEVFVAVTVVAADVIVVIVVIVVVVVVFVVVVAVVAAAVAGDGEMSVTSLRLIILHL